MCVQGYEKLDRIFKHKRVQRKWTLSANEIASQLIAGTFRGKALNEAELNLLNQTWSQATQKKLRHATVRQDYKFRLALFLQAECEDYSSQLGHRGKS